MIRPDWSEDEPRVDTQENLLQLKPHVSVDDHVEAGVNEAVELEENDRSINRGSGRIVHAHHEDDSIGQTGHQESWR